MSAVHVVHARPLLRFHLTALPSCEYAHSQGPCSRMLPRSMRWSNFATIALLFAFRQCSTFFSSFRVYFSLLLTATVLTIVSSSRRRVHRSRLAVVRAWAHRGLHSFCISPH